jgi:hypothetical protein
MRSVTLCPDPSIPFTLGVGDWVFKTVWHLSFDPAIYKAKHRIAQWISSRNQQWRNPEHVALPLSESQGWQWVLKVAARGRASEHSRFPSTSVLFHIGVMVVAGQEVAGGGWKVGVFCKRHVWISILQGWKNLCLPNSKPKEIDWAGSREFKCSLWGPGDLWLTKGRVQVHKGGSRTRKWKKNWNFPNSPKAISVYSCDELGVNESETYGLNFPSSGQNSGKWWLSN